MPYSRRRGQGQLIPKELGSLSLFLVRPLGKGKLIKVTCPRKDCNGWFIVNRKQWSQSRPDFDTRSCPHCFRPSYIRRPRAQGPKA